MGDWSLTDWSLFSPAPLMVYLTSRKHWFDWLPSLLLLAALGISLAVSDEEAAIEAQLEEFIQVVSQPCGKLRGGVDEEATIETVRSPRVTSVDSKVLNSARLKLDLQTNAKQKKWHVHIPHRHHIHIPHRHISDAARRAAAKKAKGNTLESQAVLNELVHRGILHEDCSATQKTFAAVSKMLK